MLLESRDAPKVLITAATLTLFATKKYAPAFRQGTTNAWLACATVRFGQGRIHDSNQHAIAPNISNPTMNHGINACATLKSSRGTRGAGRGNC